MNRSALRSLRPAWRWLWSLMPDAALPLRLRLGGLLRGQLRLGPVLDPAPGLDPADAVAYRRWLAARPPLGPTEHAAIAAHVAAMPAPPRISVVMPVQDAPEPLLRAAIESLRHQLYPHWELCIAAAAPQTARMLTEAAAADSRIRWTPCAAQGPAAAANAALALASGDYVVFMDHDDRLADHAFYAMAAEIEAHPGAALVYADEDRLDAGGRRCEPFFKPDFDPELLLQQNLVGRLGLYHRDLLPKGLEAGQDHALALRVGLACGPDRVRHIPHVLHHRRQPAAPCGLSRQAPEGGIAAAGRATGEALAGAGVAARLERPAMMPDTWRLLWPLPAVPPLVSIIVPTRDRATILAACAEGVLHRTDYPALELIIVDNESEEPATHALFARLAQDPRVRILPAPGPFNFAALNNRAVAEARGEVVVLLNNDIDVIGPGWLREMVAQALRPGIGAVGARLLYADGRLQHGGVVVGLGGVAGHYLLGAAREDTGHCGSLALVRSASAVTAACLALRREIYAAVGGMDAANLPVAFNDVDLCLRIGAAGWRILWTPYAELYHLESVSRGADTTAARARHFASEINHMQRRWGPTLARDPFHNPNLDPEGPRPALAAEPPRFQPWITPAA